MSTSSRNLTGSSTSADLEIVEQTHQQHYQQNETSMQHRCEEHGHEDMRATSRSYSLPLSSNQTNPLYHHNRHQHPSTSYQSSSSSYPSTTSISTTTSLLPSSSKGTDRASMETTTPPKKPSNKWSGLLHGQLIALIATSQNASSFTLEYGLGIKFPTFLLFNAYVVLAVINLVPKLLAQRQQQQRQQQRRWSPLDRDSNVYKHNLPVLNIKLLVPWNKYMFLSVLDVFPNYMTLLALQYTSLTSTTLLGSLTVPSAMIVCRILLKKVYHIHHYLGVVICMIGATLIICSDNDANSRIPNREIATINHPYSHLGDLFAIAAALLYGAQDAIGEYWIKSINGDIKEYLGMLGLFGTLYTLVLFPLIDGKEICNVLSKIPSNDTATAPTITQFALLPLVLAMVWYVMSVVLFYIVAAYFLISNDATLLILSLQACNIWAILYAIAIYPHDAPSVLFYVAMILVIFGVFYYELIGNNIHSSDDEKGASRNIDELDTNAETGHLLLLDQASSHDCWSSNAAAATATTATGVVSTEEGEDIAVENEENKNKHRYSCCYYGTTTNHELVDI